MTERAPLSRKLSAIAESATLKVDAKAKALKAEGKPVIPGVLSTGFEDALEAGRDFAAVGAAAVMTVTPYYAPGTQDGMRAYFRRYRDSLDLPVMLYQIPRRTTVSRCSGVRPTRP